MARRCVCPRIAVAPARLDTWGDAQDIISTSTITVEVGRQGCGQAEAALFSNRTRCAHPAANRRQFGETHADSAKVGIVRAILSEQGVKVVKRVKLQWSRGGVIV